MIDPTGRATALREHQADMLGNATIGRAVTATLHVSVNGTGVDGLSWRTAFTTIQDALNAASTDDEDATLILIAPHGAGYYDIDTTGDPTWAANVILKGTHRNWGQIRNNHDTATSILKLTGRASVMDLNFNLGTGGNGLILTRGGFRCYSCQFTGGALTVAGTALWLDGSTTKHGKVINCDFLGHVDNMTAILVDDVQHSRFIELVIHDCLTAIQIVGAAPDANQFDDTDIGGCGIGLDIDTGSGQHFEDVRFHDNDVNVDDEVGDHHWNNMKGPFPITILPDNLIGVTVNTGGAGAWGGDTEILAAAVRDKPFRIVGVSVEPSSVAAEWYQLRFSADSGATFYDVVQFYGVKREGSGAPSGTEFIFNKGTRISASARDVTGGDNVKVWVEIQEI